MKKIGMILLCTIILVFNFIIGANEKGLRVLPISILMTLILIFLIIKKVKEPKKNIFFKSKIDYLTLIFMFTTILPLIFGTYASYSDTVEFIIKYFFIYSVYILARNTITDKKQINYLITATLICSLIPVIIGLDYKYGKYLVWIMEKLDLLYTDSSLFSATFGYANALAIYLSFCLFLALYQIKNNTNKIVKTIYIFYALFISYIIWITISRSVIALLVVTLIIYFIAIKRNAIMNNWKKIIIIGSIVLIIGVPLMIYALHVSEPFTETSKVYYHRMDYSFKQGIKYNLELDIYAFTEEETEQDEDTAFELQIIQGNKYFKESIIATKKFGNIDGRVSIEFTPAEGYSFINLKIQNYSNGTYSIKKCYINEEEYILNYKYLPNQLGKLFSEYTFNQKSIKERMFIYNDCLKIAKDSLIIGQGGNTWQVLSYSVQEYNVTLKETHSYFFELLISYGIIGVLAFLAFIITLFIKIINQLKNDKEKNKEKTLIAIGLFFVLIHSITFDFNMSFMIIQLMVYIYIAVLLYDEQKDLKIHIAIDYLLLVFLAFILSIYARTCIAEYFMQDINLKPTVASYKNTYEHNRIENIIEKDENNIEILNELQDFMNREPYYNQTRLYFLYFRQICTNIEKFNEDELENYLNFGINKLKTVKFETPLYINTILNRTNILKNTITDLNNYKNKIQGNSKLEEILDSNIRELENIIMTEYEVNIKNLEDVDRLYYKKSDIDMVKMEYLRMINRK